MEEPKQTVTVFHAFKKNSCVLIPKPDAIPHFVTPCKAVACVSIKDSTCAHVVTTATGHA